MLSFCIEITAKFVSWAQITTNWNMCSVIMHFIGYVASCYV